MIISMQRDNAQRSRRKYQKHTKHKENQVFTKQNIKNFTSAHHARIQTRTYNYTMLLLLIARCII